MKKLFNFSLLAILLVVVLASCSKNRDYYQDDREVATVYEFADGTPYSIIQYNKDGTYAIIESLDANTKLWPDIDDRLEGVFVEGRQSRVYNRTYGTNINIYVTENITTRNEALDALDYYADRYLTSAKVNKESLKINSSAVAPRMRINAKQ